MKVAVIFSVFSKYHLARLASIEKINEINLLAVEIYQGTDEYLWDEIKNVGLKNKIRLYPDKRQGDVLNRVVHRDIASLLDIEQPNAVCVCGWSEAEAKSASRWAIVNGKGLILMSESTSWDFIRVSWKEAIKRRMIKHYDGAIVGGAFHKDYLVSLGMDPEVIELGYDVIDNNYFSEMSSRICANPILKIGEPKLPNNYFLASGRFVEKKNHLRLLEAYAEYIKNVDKPWSLILLGDGIFKNDILGKIKKLGIEELVHLPGFIQYDVLPYYYSMARVFVHPSTTEQWGLVVNEAMASGLPVLVSKFCGCVSELVRSGRNGETFDPYDIPVLTKLFINCHSGFFNLEEYGKESIKIIANYSSDRFGAGIYSCLKKSQSRNRLTDKLGYIEKIYLSARFS